MSGELEGDDFSPVGEPQERAPRRTARARHDVAADLSPAKRRKPRAPSARATAKEKPPVDGFKNPLQVVAPKGHVAHWVTLGDLDRHFGRPWRHAIHGKDPIGLNFLVDAKKGEKVRFRELFLMLSTVAADKAYKERDPALQLHRARFAELKDRAEASEANGQRGYWKGTDRVV